MQQIISQASTHERDLVIPLLPATHSKHVWRYSRFGTPYKVRLCLDLKASGVNDAVADWKLRYRDLHDVACKVKQGDWLASLDISRFYLRLPAGRKLRPTQRVQDPSFCAKTSKANKFNVYEKPKRNKFWRTNFAPLFKKKHKKNNFHDFWKYSRVRSQAGT